MVNVPLGDRSYPIYIGPGLLDDGARLRKHIPGNTALVVTNETIAPLYLKRCAPRARALAPQPHAARCCCCVACCAPCCGRRGEALVR